MKTILILALDGVMDSSLAIAIDTLRAAQAFHARDGKTGATRIQIVAHGKSVTTANGMQLRADLRLADVAALRPPPEWVIVPGLGLTSEAAIAARFRQKDAAAAVELLRQLPERTRIGASCSAVFLLAESELLHGRHVTMTWWLAARFRKRYPDVKLDETRMLVRDGRFLTAGAAYAQLDLALGVITDTMGVAVADLCSRYLLIDRRPSQARYMMPTHSQQVDPTVVAAERWIDARIASPISVTALAAALAVSPKTLARRIDAAVGISPVKFIQQRRLLQAIHLIETTAKPIETVAAEVGYQDSTALRKLIKREFGTTPAALRQ